ncbi:MAG: DUF1778 domain-containing protein [Hyphomicrobiales bacterium]
MTALAPRRTAAKSRRDAIINLRVPAKLRDLIDSAAEAVGKTRTQFLVDSAQSQAIDILLDKKVFKLNEAGFSAFHAALKTAGAQSQTARAFARKAPWRPDGAGFSGAETTAFSTSTAWEWSRYRAF